MVTINKKTEKLIPLIYLNKYAMYYNEIIQIASLKDGEIDKIKDYKTLKYFIELYED